MFTDGPVTPRRLECLIELLRENSRREWGRSDIAALMQPSGLPDVTEASGQVRDVIKASLELNICVERDGAIKLTQSEKNSSASELLLQRLDEVVFCSTDTEPYCAPFYSYLLGLGEASTANRSGVAWANAFNQECPAVARTQNPFNETKWRGLMRWYGYTGHGWIDPAGVFQPSPYGRLRRQLRRIFDKDSRISGDAFIARLSACCPELDCGEIFGRTLPQHNPDARTCTLGLSHALVDLHQDGCIRLSCAPDSRGWSIDSAQPPNDGKTLRSGRIDYVEYIG